MIVALLRRLPLRAALSGAALLALVGLPARAQYYPAGAYPAMGGPAAYGYGYGYGPGYGYGAPAYPPPAYAMPPQMTYPGPAGTYPPLMRPYPAGPVMPFQQYVCPPHPCLPGTEPPPAAEKPTQPERPEQPKEPGKTEETPQREQPSDQLRQDNNFDPTGANAGQESSLPGGGQGAAGGGSSVALAAPGGYLDNPIPITTFRLRYDAAFNENRPDRAEYFYGAWQELGFHTHGIQNHGAFFDRHPLGPEVLPGNLNYQQPEAYFEYAFRNIVSGFIQVPYRYVQFNNLQEDPDTDYKRNSLDQPNAGVVNLKNPSTLNFYRFREPGPENEGNPQTKTNGFSDLQFGFKLALLASPTQFLTFQLRTYSPTGDSFQGLGTGHWSLEPSLLYYKRINRLVLQGQLTEWTPIHGGLAGDIVEYGGGLGYALYQGRKFSVMPITEFLGWTVLNGYESVFQPINSNQGPGWETPLTHGVAEAGGNTIVNGKWGVRFFWGQGQSLYVGYGRALTGTHWYTDDFRLEYRIFFGANKGIFRSL